LFLGTISTKPIKCRCASAIYLIKNGYGILMDSSEGSYGQLMDHFGSLEKVNEALLRTKVIFITHIHGDHQLGVLKLMWERDRLLTEEEVAAGNKLFVVVPLLMQKWMQLFINDQLEHPEMVELVLSQELNPE